MIKNHLNLGLAGMPGKQTTRAEGNWSALRLGRVPAGEIIIVGKQVIPERPALQKYSSCCCLVCLTRFLNQKRALHPLGGVATTLPIRKGVTTVNTHLDRSLRSVMRLNVTEDSLLSESNIEAAWSATSAEVS